MTRKRRTRILILGDRQLRSRLAAETEALYTIEEIHPARNCLIMTSLRETARNAVFYPGEVLASEARVLLKGVVGLGLLMGNDLQAARELAVIDAAWNAQVPQHTAWEALLAEEESRLEDRLQKQRQRNGNSRVVFETMDQEAPE